jgi:hypothetical protein
MSELLYTTAKCKKMADEHSHFILSIMACRTGPMSAQSTCVGTECASGARGRWHEARVGGRRGAQCSHAGDSVRACAGARGG